MTAKAIRKLDDLPRQCIRSLRGLDIEKLRAWATAAQQNFVLADVAGCKGKRAILRLLGRELGLPEWFGANLDALYDALTDDGIWPIDSGAVIVLDGLRQTESFGPAERDALLDVFRDVAEHYSKVGIPFRVLYR